MDIVKKCILQQSLVLTSVNYTGKSVRDNKYNSVEREIDESLARLQTDYIDFYIMHWPDENTPIEETMAVCNMLKKKGKSVTLECLILPKN